MKNPARDFPKAIFLAIAVIVIGYALGTLVIGIVIPTENIDLLQALLVAYNKLWDSFGLSWLGNIMAAFIMFGVLGQVSALVNGPSVGVMAVAQSGYLPRSLQSVNKNGLNQNILYIYGAVVSLLSLVIIVLPTVESAYQIMSQLATIIYLVMVLIIYGAFIRLRRTEPYKNVASECPEERSANGPSVVSVFSELLRHCS